MKIDILNIKIRQIRASEPMPFALLILADPSKAVIDKYLKLSKVYVAAINELDIGVFVLQKLEKGIFEIKNIAISPDFQGQGIVTFLIEYAIRIARNLKAKTIQIGTANSSLGQLALYQKLGFEISEIKKDFFIDNYKEAIFENGMQAKDMIMLQKPI